MIQEEEQLKSFRIQNMKSFVDSKEIEVKPITIFVGKNSCGKSSLIRFLAVLSQTAKADSDSPIKFYGKMVDYGNYEDVKHHGSSEKMSFELKYNVDVNISRKRYTREYFLKRIMGEKIEEPHFRDERELVLKVTLDKPHKTLMVEKIELFEKDKCLYFIGRTDENQYSFYANYLYENGEFLENVFYMDINKIRFEKFIPSYIFMDAYKSIFSMTYGYEIDDDRLDYLLKHKNETELLSEEDKVVLKRWEQFEYYSDLTREIFERFEAEAGNIRYIGPFRDDPSRIYRDPEYNSHDVGVRGENTSNELIRDYRRKNPRLIKNISAWTKSVLGVEIVLKEVSGGLFQILLKDKNGVETNLIDNGYGFSQVLPIVTEAIKLSTNRTVTSIMGEDADEILLVEQPELHLHPSAQASLADLFVNSVLEGKNNRIMLETHSEHLIRKIQILIASKDCPLTKDMVRIYYVDKNEKGDAFVKEMGIMDNGNFEEEWPSGFFDQGYLLAMKLSEETVED